MDYFSLFQRIKTNKNLNPQARYDVYHPSDQRLVLLNNFFGIHLVGLFLLFWSSGAAKEKNTKGIHPTHPKKLIPSTPPIQVNMQILKIQDFLYLK